MTKAWRSSLFAWPQAIRNKEQKTLYAVLALAAFLRLKMAYLL